MKVEIDPCVDGSVANHRLSVNRRQRGKKSSRFQLSCGLIRTKKDGFFTAPVKFPQTLMASSYPVSDGLLPTACGQARDTVRV